MTNETLFKLYDNYLSKVHHCYKDEVGNRPCDNGVACDSCMTEEASRDWKHFLGRYQHYYGSYMSFERIATLMQRNDPNGDYDAGFVYASPATCIEILERWIEDAGSSVPNWIYAAIEFLKDE